jgi:hypothetical protein
MKFTIPAIATLAAVLAVATSHPASAAVKHHKHQTASATEHKPLTGTIYGNRRRGGYSFHKADVISGGPAGDPAAQGYYPSGGLDDDLFYTMPKGPFGGYTPYMH